MVARWEKPGAPRLGPRHSGPLARPARLWAAPRRPPLACRAPAGCPWSWCWNWGTPHQSAGAGDPRPHPLLLPWQPSCRRQEAPTAGKVAQPRSARALPRPPTGPLLPPPQAPVAAQGSPGAGRRFVAQPLAAAPPVIRTEPPVIRTEPPVIRPGSPVIRTQRPFFFGPFFFSKTKRPKI